MHSPNYGHLSPNQIEAKERERRLLTTRVVSLRKRVRRKAEKRYPGRPMGWLYGTLYFLDTQLEVDGAPRLPKTGGSEPPEGFPFGGVRTGRKMWPHGFSHRSPQNARREQDRW